MPRKPSIGPALLAIERLSDGRDPRLVDDFTQEPLAQPHAKAPTIDNAQAHHNRLNEERAAAQRAMLTQVMPQLFEPQAVTQVSTGNGERLLLVLPNGKALTVPTRPFRRL